MTEHTLLYLQLRSQLLKQDERGYTMWDVTTTDAIMPAAKAAIIICDMWDKHWSRGASERVDILAPTMNQVIAQARSVGVKIIHAPSETMHYYAHTPARLRMLEVPDCVMPPLIEHVDPPLPVDASDNGSDTGETDWYKAWSRQHPVIEIDQTQDGISDSGDEIYRFLQHHGIHQVFIMGVHTNMCILKRSFAIKAMVRRGVPVALVRDLTDAMYNPAMPPYVNHNEGTQLVIDYIEKFWCPTVSSADLANVDKVGK